MHIFANPKTNARKFDLKVTLCYNYTEPLY